MLIIVHKTALIALLTLRLAPVGADEFPLVRAHITAAPPQIDGVLDDPAWDQAAPADQFFQREPVEGAPATARWLDTAAPGDTYDTDPRWRLAAAPGEGDGSGSDQHSIVACVE